MKRLELIQEIEVLERRKVTFDNVLNDINSRYFSNGVVSFELETSDYNKKYRGERIKFNAKTLKSYLVIEISELEKEINEKIERLKEV